MEMISSGTAPNIEIIRNAIEYNHVLNVMFHQESLLVEPYFLVHNSNRELVMLAFQVEGQVDSVEKAWIQVKVDHIKDLKVTGQYYIDRNVEYPLMISDIDEIIFY